MTLRHGPAQPRELVVDLVMFVIVFVAVIAWLNGP
jgi:hypothetical protein